MYVQVQHAWGGERGRGGGRGGVYRGLEAKLYHSTHRHAGAKLQWQLLSSAHFKSEAATGTSSPGIGMCEQVPMEGQDCGCLVYLPLACMADLVASNDSYYQIWLPVDSKLHRSHM